MKCSVWPASDVWRSEGNNSGLENHFHGRGHQVTLARPRSIKIYSDCLSGLKNTKLTDIHPVAAINSWRTISINALNALFTFVSSHPKRADIDARSSFCVIAHYLNTDFLTPSPYPSFATWTYNPNNTHPTTRASSQRAKRVEPPFI